MYNVIKKMCDERKISIAELERECKLGNGTIACWKKSSPSVSNLKKVANFFNVPIDFFWSEGAKK